MEPAAPVSEAVVSRCSAAWREGRAHAGLEANLRRAGIPEEAFWQRYISWVSSMQGDYPGVLLERVMRHARPGDAVLDIGAGAGLFALPLSRVVRTVTAVEPSPAQAKQLRAAIRREGTGNITVVEQRWEDIEPGYLGEYDLVLAIHSLQMDDMGTALRTMCRVAERCLLLIHPKGNQLSEVVRDLFGIEPAPDYSGLCQMLTALGYPSEVEMVDYSYAVLLEQQLEILRYNPGLDAGQRQALRDYVVSHGMTTQLDGGEWLRRSYTDALISVTCD